ncbi:MAG: succinate--CoA ligase subunit alpha [Candidatus Thermoplasmatota archaeon]|nr:succinate--CoA ligase subunit alpha [Candidatus Thermoplasmatota archaeon]MBS3789319.1 succinate--CoA ligase subunit alpha [Candidatus Thermoplasmatota archaeon]
MGILVDEDTEVIVQGITGQQGMFHTEYMEEYGTNVVAGVTPGKGGKKVKGVPVFNTVEGAKEKAGGNASIIFVPAPFAKDAAFEAIEAGMNPVVIITESIPVQDSAKIMRLAEMNGTTIIGPNTPGIISPGKSKVGIMPNHIFEEGNIGLVSRSGTLTYEIVNTITEKGYGQSTAFGLGGDPIVGMDFIDALDRFSRDDGTDAVIMIGEIGGSAEEKAAKHIQENIDKPVIAYIAGRTAPKGKRMGHAGAIVSEGGTGTAESKIEALEGAGVSVARMPTEIGELLDNEL